METLIVERTQTVATITLNRMAVRNAFNETTIAELTQTFLELSDNDDVRAIVLAANGPAFCAGADLTWMNKIATYSYEENLADAKQLSHMLQAIYLCAKPVIAKIQGDCYGGGVGLVAAADIAISSPAAHFCLSEVKLGLIPATISPYVIKAIGERAARRYFLTAEKFSAQEAQRRNLVDQVVPAAALNEYVEALVAAMVLNSPQAVKEAKKLIRDVAGEPLDEAVISDTIRRIAEIRVSDEGREGIASFIEKRPAKW